MPTPTEFFELAVRNTTLGLKVKCYNDLDDLGREQVRQTLPKRCKQVMQKDCPGAERLLEVAEKLEAMAPADIHAVRMDILNRCAGQDVGIVMAKKLYPDKIPVEVICTLSDKFHAPGNYFPCVSLLDRESADDVDTFLKHLANKGDGYAVRRVGRLLQLEKQVVYGYFRQCLAVLLEERRCPLAIAELVIRLRDFKKAKELIGRWTKAWKEDASLRQATQNLLFFLHCHGKLTIDV